jgi:hypothetical protein
MDQDVYLIQRGIRWIRKEYIVGAIPAIFLIKEGGSPSQMYLRMIEQLTLL